MDLNKHHKRTPVRLVCAVDSTLWPSPSGALQCVGTQWDFEIFRSMTFFIPAGMNDFPAKDLL